MNRQVDCSWIDFNKGLFQEALRAAIGQSSNVEQKAHWANYHQQSVEANIEGLLNATAASRDLSLDRLCVARSLMLVPGYTLCVVA